MTLQRAVELGLSAGQHLVDARDCAPRARRPPAMRSLVTRIDLAPRAGGGVSATVYGDLAEMVALAAGEGRKESDPPARGARGSGVGGCGGRIWTLFAHCSQGLGRRLALMTVRYAATIRRLRLSCCRSSSNQRAKPRD